jgi:hypothetical protein
MIEHASHCSSHPLIDPLIDLLIDPLIDPRIDPLIDDSGAQKSEGRAITSPLTQSSHSNLLISTPFHYIVPQRSNQKSRTECMCVCVCVFHFKMLQN